MAKLPTAAENGRMILDIFKHYKTRPGEVLMTNTLVAYAAKNRLEMSDVQSGLEYAGEQGWIENGQSSSIRLTEAGFSAV